MALIGVIVLLSTVVGARWYIHDRNRNAEELLNQTLLQLEQKPLLDETGRANLELVLAQYRQTAAGPVAGYLKGNQDYRQGKLDEAAAVYTDNLKQSINPELKVLQEFSLAVISFEKQDYAEAASRLEKLQAARSFISEDLFILLALSYEKSEQPAKAIATYENMIQLHGSSFFKPWAEERLIVLKKKV